MHPSMLPFGRKVFAVIRLFLTMTNALEIFTTAHNNVMLDTEIVSAFKSCVRSLFETCSYKQVDVEDTLAIKVCKELLSKILNTVSNDFLIYITQLDKIETNKGTGTNTYTTS